METGYSVLIAKPELPDLKKLADVLEEFHRVSRDEAVEMARRSWGFAGENLVQDRAQVLADKCRENGIEVITIDSGDITPLPVEKDLIKAEVKPTGMNYTLLTDETGFVPWEKAVLIAAAPVKEKKIISQVSVEDPNAVGKVYLATLMANVGIPYPGDSPPAREHGPQRGEEKSKSETDVFELFFYLELFFSVFPRHLRMRSDSFDYSYLKKRNEYSSQLNFRIFLDDVAAMALKSLKNLGVKAILGQKSTFSKSQTFYSPSKAGQQPLCRLGYDCLSHLEKESRWLLAISSL